MLVIQSWTHEWSETRFFTESSDYNLRIFVKKPGFSGPMPKCYYTRLLLFIRLIYHRLKKCTLFLLYILLSSVRLPLTSKQAPLGGTRGAFDRLSVFGSHCVEPVAQEMLFMVYIDPGFLITNDNSEQLNLFTQPIAVSVEIGCTVERAAELVQDSKSSIDYQLSKNKLYLQEATTGTWQIYSTGKKDKSILVNVAFIFSPRDKYWQLA